MRVDLDQIEFYHGPSPLSPFTSAKSVTGGHAPTHAPRYFQQSSPAGFGFRPRRDEVLLEKPPPVTGTTHEWNIFDFEINNVYVPTRPEMAKDVEPPVATDIPAACHIPVGFGPSALAFPEPVPLTDSAITIPYPAKLDHLDHVMRRNDLPDAVPDAMQMETSRLSCVPVPVPAPAQTGHVSSNSSVVGVVGGSQKESVKQKFSTAGPSDTLCPGDYENDTEPSQASGLVENPSSRANDGPERTKDAGTSEEKPAPSGPSTVPTVRSSSESSRVRTTPGTNIPVRHPPVAVVVPAPSPSWEQGVARRSTRAAAVVCKKRLRSGRDIRRHQDGNTTFHDTEQPQKRMKKKRRLSIRPISDSSGSSIPVASHCSGAIQGVRGSALLTVESNPGLKPAYFFTFVPEPSPMLSRPDSAAIPRQQREYTSDENALLVRLKEKEAMSWSEITTYFPDRNMPSLQVHYSTKLRHKASSRSGKPRRYK